MTYKSPPLGMSEEKTKIDQLSAVCSIESPLLPGVTLPPSGRGGRQS